MKPVAAKVDIKQDITNRIIAMLEKGGNEYRKRWTESARNGFPRSAATGKDYRGVNTLLLWGEAYDKGYSSNLWITYKQAADMGGNVRKGEKSVQCIFFQFLEDKTELDTNGNPVRFPMIKPFWLFNVAQCDNLPESLTDKPETTKEFTPIESAEALLTASGATIAYGGNKAFYSLTRDAIQLPEKEQFVSSEAFYSTALHELTHWTGHESRNAREFGKRFGDSAYAFEELVAELGSSFVCGSLGFDDVTMPFHASYLENWLEVLRNDKNAIFTAAKQAGLAYDYIMAKSIETVTASVTRQSETELETA